MLGNGRSLRRNQFSAAQQHEYDRQHHGAPDAAAGRGVPQDAESNQTADGLDESVKRRKRRDIEDVPRIGKAGVGARRRRRPWGDSVKRAISPCGGNGEPLSEAFDCENSESDRAAGCPAPDHAAQSPEIRWKNSKCLPQTERRHREN